MKKITYLVLAFIIFTSCQKQKIGFVDNGTIINNIQEKIDVESKFQEKENTFRKKAETLSQEFQAEAQKGQAEAQALAKRNNMKKAEELMTGLQQKQQQLQQQMQNEQQVLTKEFQTEIDSVISKVKKFVASYGKANGYTFILGTSDAASTVMYGKDEKDLTQTIIDSLNSEYNKTK